MRWQLSFIHIILTDGISQFGNTWSVSMRASRIDLRSDLSTVTVIP